MRDYLTIGSSPCNEDCVQVGTEDYIKRAREECNRYITVIKQKCGDPPAGASLTIKSFPHDFGTYLEVVVTFDTNDETAREYAYYVEENSPLTWDDTDPNDSNFDANAI